MVPVSSLEKRDLSATMTAVVKNYAILLSVQIVELSEVSELSWDRAIKPIRGEIPEGDTVSE